MQLTSLVDQNWTNGIHNNQSVLLFENTWFNQEKLNGVREIKSKDVSLPIMNIEKDSQWIRVEVPTGSDLSQFAYPNEIEVSNNDTK